MSEMITKNHALVAQFGDTLDRLMDGIENFVANSRPESEPPHLAGLPQQRDDCLLPVGRQDSLQGIGHRADACRKLSGGVQIASIVVRKRNTTKGHQVVFLAVSGRISFVLTVLTVPGVCRWRKEQT